jgi:hypothetical protein
MKPLLSLQYFHLFANHRSLVRTEWQISPSQRPGLDRVDAGEAISFSEEPNPGTFAVRSNSNNNAPSTYFIDAKLA